MKPTEGKITFIHHEKNRAVIEYIDNNRKKTIQANLDFKTEQIAKDQKIRKKNHRFLVGDQVSFLIKKTGANGSVQYAENLKYLYNTALELLINKALVDNKFLGYIKITDDKYFIKEIESYLFFPLNLSVYEIAPADKDTEQPVYFKLDNLEKPDKITAILYNHHYIPEYLKIYQVSNDWLILPRGFYDTLIKEITKRGYSYELRDERVKNKLKNQIKLNINLRSYQKTAINKAKKAYQGCRPCLLGCLRAEGICPRRHACRRR